jgi:hypothetical protein
MKKISVVLFVFIIAASAQAQDRYFGYTYTTNILPKGAIDLELWHTSRIGHLNQFYQAHEAYYNATGRFRAFGEGPGQSTDWQWEWVTIGDDRTWISLDDKYEPVTAPPIVFTKIAFGLLALSNRPFTLSMDYLWRPICHILNMGMVKASTNLEMCSTQPAVLQTV